MDLEDVRAVTDRLHISQVLLAYANGLFPMGLGDDGAAPYGWWSPVRRGVLKPGDLRVSKSLRKSMRRFSYTMDARFDDVVAACADPARPGAWIDEGMREVYRELHAAGAAHSIEVWRDGDVVGGLFGLQLGDLFIGESMFHRETDASKAALARLVAYLDEATTTGQWLIDTQWSTPHLESLGVSEISSFEYVRMAKKLTKPHFTQDFPNNSPE